MFRFRLISAPTLFSPRKGPNGWRGPWLLVKRIPPSHTSSESRVWILVLISPVLGQEGAPKGMPANTVITSQGVCLTQHRGVRSLFCFFFAMAHCLYTEQTIPVHISQFRDTGHWQTSMGLNPKIYSLHSSVALCSKGSSLLHLLQTFLEIVAWNQHILPFLTQPQKNYKCYWRRDDKLSKSMSLQMLGQTPHGRFKPWKPC